MSFTTPLSALLSYTIGLCQSAQKFHSWTCHDSLFLLFAPCPVSILLEAVQAENGPSVGEYRAL